MPTASDSFLKDIEQAFSEGRWGVAVRLIERIRGAHTDRAEMDRLLILAYIHTRDFDAAVDAADRALVDASSESRRRLLPVQADALVLAGLYSEAASALKEAMTLEDPFNEAGIDSISKRIDRLAANEGPALRDEIFEAVEMAPSPPPQARMPLPATVAGTDHTRVNQLPRYPSVFRNSATPYNPSDQQPFQVFISYRFRDAPLVRRVAERLMAAGIRVWFHEYSISPGEYYHSGTSILQGLEASSCALLFTSGEYARSAHCEQEVIWAKQRFANNPDRIIEVALEPPFSIKEIFQMPNGIEAIRWRKPTSFEQERDALDVILVALQPYSRLVGSPPPLPSCGQASGSYRARCAPVQINLCGMQLVQWELDARSGGDLARFSVAQGSNLVMELKFSFSLGQSDIDNILPSIPDYIDDRKVYERFMAFGERHIKEWGPLWSKFKRGGIHLNWVNNRPHLSYSYYNGKAWIRRYFIVLTDPAMYRPVEVIFTFSMAGDNNDYARFFTEATRMDRMVQSANLVFLKEFRQVRLAAEAMDSGQLDRCVVELENVLNTDSANSSAWFGLMQACLRKRDWERCTAYGWKARGVVPEEDPWKGRILWCLAESLLLSGNVRDAHNIYLECLAKAKLDPAIPMQALETRINGIESNQLEILVGEIRNQLEKGGIVGVMDRMVPEPVQMGASPSGGSLLPHRPPKQSTDDPSVNLSKSPQSLVSAQRAFGTLAAIAVPALVIAAFFLRTSSGSFLTGPTRFYLALGMAGITAFLGLHNTVGAVRASRYGDKTAKVGVLFWVLAAVAAGVAGWLFMPQ